MADIQRHIDDAYDGSGSGPLSEAELDEYSCCLCGYYDSWHTAFYPLDGCLTLAICAECTGPLVRESRERLLQQTKRLRPWRAFHGCDRCEAHVPGTISRPLWPWREEPGLLYLCPQCCLTLYRQTHPYSRRWAYQANLDALARLSALAAEYERGERR